MAESNVKLKEAEKNVTDELANEADANSRHGDDSSEANSAKDKRAAAESEAGKAKK